VNDDLLRLWTRAERILDELLDLDADERAARVGPACGDDAALQRAVRELLDAERASGEFLARPALAVPGDEPAASSEIGRRIGPYRLVAELGRGGMGIVYAAERDDGEFQQRVALKLLDAGVRTPAAIERFRREREILARLQHPHVARLYDGGVTDDGNPFLVMELVEGARIDEYCDARGLSLGERLRLFVQVCQAVEYAHGRLVVHRDIKPANVVVDHAGAVRLLDFGIAGWLDEIGEAAGTTATAARVLTPAYAAPEQLRGEPAAVATDIYQLGLLLYELIAGRRAHGDSRSSPAELIDTALHRDPPPPSQGVAADRLARRLAGDLDAIALKALRKEPAERYATAEALRRDVESVLADRPVEARRGNALYRLRKGLRRHRVPVAAAAAAGLSIVLGVAGVLAQARVTAHERDRARSAEARAAAINDFLVQELLLGATPEKARGRELTVAEVLGNASRAVGTALGSQPATEGDVRLALAQSYVALGNYPEARAHAEAAMSCFASSTTGDRLRARRQLAELTMLEGRVQEARAEADALVAACLGGLGEDHGETLRARLLAARVATSEGRPTDAAQALQALLEAQSRISPGDWRLALEIREALIDALTRAQRAADAAALAEQTLGILRERLGPDHPASIEGLRRLATAKSKLLLHPHALALHREVLALCERTAGPEHPDTADAWVDVAVDLSRLNRAEPAREATEQALAIYEPALGADHPRTIRALRNLAVLASQAGNYEDAERAYARVLEARTRRLGEFHPDTIGARRDRQLLLLRAGRIAEARTEARTIAAAYERLASGGTPDPTLLDAYAGYLLAVDPPDCRDPQRARVLAEQAVAATGRREFLKLATLARACRATGDAEGAIAAAREALALPESIRSWTTEILMVELLQEHRSEVELEAFLRERLERTRALRGPDDPLIAKTLRHLAQLEARAGRTAEAERLLGESLAQLRRTLPESDWEVGRAKSELGAQMLERGARAEALPLLVDGYETLAADPGIDAALLAAARRRVVEATAR
jgi:serine/threonine-protein kinase